MRCLDRGFKIINFPLADITVGNEHLYNLAIHTREHSVEIVVIGVQLFIKILPLKTFQELVCFINHGRLLCVKCE